MTAAQPHDSTDGGDPAGVSRRTVLRGAVTAGVVGMVGAAAACSSPSNTTGAGTSSTSSSTPASSSAGSGGGSAAVLAKTSDIPVGGGKIFAAEKVVVTQPASGQFKGFSATCTHMGCTVNRVEQGKIKCPCHGSVYSVKDASVLSGPAPRPLPSVAITVKGDSISLA